MKNSRLSVLAVCLLVSTLLGCRLLKKKKAQEIEGVGSAAAVTASAEPEEPPEIRVADEKIPTPEDFEDEAFDKVTDKTYKPELDTLKKELEAAK